MRIKFSIAEDEVSEEKAYLSDVFENGKQFPVLNIGRNSYIEEAVVDTVLDENVVYNLQIGRHTSIAQGVTFIIDLNHDYRRVCQGRMGGKL